MMARRACLVLAVWFIGLHAFCQPYFSKTYEGFYFSGATIAPDSGLVLSGGSSLLRVDREGTPSWFTSYSTSTGDEVWIRDVARVGDSSFVYVGYAPTGSGTAMVQQVVSASGLPVWGGQLEFFNGDELSRAERASDGSVVVCGWNFGLSTTSGYAVRLGSDLDSYSTPLVSNPGGSMHVSIVVAVRPTSDGGFIGVGTDEGLLTAYKATAGGDIAWSRAMPEGGPDFNSVHAVEGEALSTYIATETFGDLFRLIRLDQDGVVQWSRTYEMPGDDQPTGLVRFANGDLWICGRGWLMACSATGDVLWAHSLPYLALGMEPTLEGDGVFLFGYAAGDGWLMRTDLNGQVPDCPDSTVVPIVATETLVATPHGPPNPGYDLGSYGVNFIPGSVPATSTDCMVTMVPAGRAEEPGLRAFPIPFTDRLTLELPFSHDRVELIDGRGAICRAVSTNNEPSIVLGREDLPPGLYLLRVMKAGLSVAAQPVIVE